MVACFFKKKNDLSA